MENCTTPEFGGVDEVEFSVVLCVCVLCVCVIDRQIDKLLYIAPIHSKEPLSASVAR